MLIDLAMRVIEDGFRRFDPDQGARVYSSRSRDRYLGERPGLADKPGIMPPSEPGTEWLTQAVSQEISPTRFRPCSRHERRHRGKQHEHQQRQDAGGRREAGQIFSEGEPPHPYDPANSAGTSIPRASKPI